MKTRTNQEIHPAGTRALGLLTGAWLLAMATVNPAAAADPSVPAATSDRAPATAEAVRAALPDPPVPVAAVRALLYARPFVLDEPFAYTFLHDQPAITRGWILVLAVDPEAAKPRDVEVPVLYAGDTPVHLTNNGYPSGHLVVLVPDRNDPAREPFYFGSMELPERVDLSRGAQERALAVARGGRPFPAEQVNAAVAEGGAPLHVPDSVQLFRAVADLIDRFAPDEAERAQNYRTPVVEE